MAAKRKNKTHPRTSRALPSASKFGPKDTPETRVAFLAVMAKGGSPTRAAAAIGIDRRTAYYWRENDEEFAKDWDEAVQAGIDLLEDEARRRAHDGFIATESFDKETGERTHYRMEYSDTLMSLMLKGRRPEVYRDKVEHSGSVEVQHSVEVTFVKGTKK